MERLLMSAALLCFCLSVAAAQDIRVTGVVVSEEDGEPVVGASVLVKGTYTGTITDISGAFTLQGVQTGQHARRIVCGNDNK